MTDLTVAGVDMAPGDSCDAAEMRVTLLGLGIGASQVMQGRLRLVERRDEWRRHGITHRRDAAAPIGSQPK